MNGFRLMRNRQTALNSRYWGLAVAAIAGIIGFSEQAIAQLPGAIEWQWSETTDHLTVSQPQVPDLGSLDQYLSPTERQARLVLSLSQRRVYLYHGDTVTASYAVAVGHPDTPTPVGDYEVFQMIVDPVWQSPWTGEVHAPGPNSALGVRWIGFVEMSNGIIGFHGTPTVSSIGHAVSNGCVRMRNTDVMELFDQVTVGTPVSVIP